MLHGQHLKKARCSKVHSVRLFLDQRIGSLLQSVPYAALSHSLYEKLRPIVRPSRMGICIQSLLLHYCSEKVHHHHGREDERFLLSCQEKEAICYMFLSSS